jgi:flagellar hook-length control protein FliK
MVNNIVASTTGSAALTNTGAGIAAGSTPSNGFGQMLVQVLGGSATATNGSAAIPDLAQMLASLLAVPGGKESLPTAVSDPEAMKLVLNRISEQPELLEDLLGNEEMQEWMMQASMLMQALQLMPQQVQPGQAHEQDTAAESGQLPLNSVNIQQAQDILRAFADASSHSASNVFVEQLQEKLAGILAKHPELAVLAANTVSKKDAAKDQTASSIQQNSAGLHLNESAGTAKGVRGNKQNVNHDGKVADAREMTEKVHTSTVVSHSTRLEMLAAKSLPINRLELLTGSSEQSAAETVQAVGITDEDSQPFSFTQELNRLVPQKAMLSADAVVRADSLIEDMGQFLLGKLRLQNGNGITEARLTLNPETLGQVDVKLTMQNGQLVAQFAAHSVMGKDVLESQLSQLRLALQNQGIQVEKLEVTQSSSLQSGMFQEQRHQQQSQQFNRENQSDRHPDGGDDYAVEAAAILKGRKDSQQDGFDVTA